MRAKSNLPDEGRDHADPLAQLPVHHHIQIVVILLHFAVEQLTARFLDVTVMSKCDPCSSIVPERGKGEIPGRCDGSQHLQSNNRKIGGK